MKTSKEKQLTFEQIAERFDMSISEVNSVINTAYNKMVHELVFTHHFDIWDVVVELKGQFRMTEKEAVEKLNFEHQELLKKSAQRRGDN
jgi:hypothetical protein